MGEGFAIMASPKWDGSTQKTTQMVIFTVFKISPMMIEMTADANSPVQRNNDRFAPDNT
jgi:hypothetical protein